MDVDERVVDVEGWWMWREGRFGGRVDVEKSSVCGVFDITV